MTVISPGATHEVFTNEDDELDDGSGDRRGCHLITSDYKSYCGLPSGAGVHPDPPINIDGPVCDGPQGCGQQRCPTCVEEYHDAH